MFLTGNDIITCVGHVQIWWLEVVLCKILCNSVILGIVASCFLFPVSTPVSPMTLIRLMVPGLPL